MPRISWLAAAALLGLGCLFFPAAHSQPTTLKNKPTPKLEPVAETKLLMLGMAEPNLRSLGKILHDKPAEAEAWRFARGQALLISEMGNLLMIRPPRTTTGQDIWMTQAVELRSAAANLARLLAAKDYGKSRSALASVANVCNHCHQAFQTPNRVDPFEVE
jgi:hypothetical protein